MHKPISSQTEILAGRLLSLVDVSAGVPGFQIRFLNRVIWASAGEHSRKMALLELEAIQEELKTALAPEIACMEERNNLRDALRSVIDNRFAEAAPEPDEIKIGDVVEHIAEKWRAVVRAIAGAPGGDIAFFEEGISEFYYKDGDCQLAQLRKVSSRSTVIG